MRKWWKTAALLLIACCTAAAVPVSSKDITLSLVPVVLRTSDGGAYALSAPAIQGKMYLPLRKAADALHKSAVWEEGKLRIHRSGKIPSENLKAGAGSLNSPYPQPSGKARTLVWKGAQLWTVPVTEEERNVTIKLELVLYKGTFYIPLRSFALAFGQQVQWDAAARTVTLGDTLPAAKPDDGKQGEPQPPDDDAPGSAGEPSTGSMTGNDRDREAVQAFTALEASCEADLRALYEQYDPSKTKQEQKDLIAKAKAALDSCKIRFDALYTGFQSQGVSASVLEEAKKQYEAGLGLLQGL
ncbi:stalk domain-containing protein [Paenibacillus gansuensis]|uniref:Stalk domain-containing protein n=1 Tax=Paenibacillus gansuensis TaxID=306542 RepID=A0ABW5PC16_9BACL